MSEMDGGEKGALVWGGDAEEERGRFFESESGDGDPQGCGGRCEERRGNYLPAVFGAELGQDL